MEKETSSQKSESINEIEYSRQNALNLLERKNIDNNEAKEKIKKMDNIEDILSYTKKLIEKNPLLRGEEFTQGKVEIIDSYQEHLKKREIGDFVKYYNNRFNSIAEILKQRDMKNLTSIRRIKEMKDKEDVSTIGMILDINESKNGHLMITIEDKTGVMRCIFMNNKEQLFERAKNLVLDEVIGISGTAGKDIIFVEDFIYPDIPISNTQKKSPEEEYAVITGDMQIGTNIFYYKEFQNFINWLSGKKTPSAHKNIIKKIKYLIIPGDIIEGVGIFPGQEDELVATSAKEQYHMFVEYIKQLSERIQIIICPGNHDAVRIAEPQPAFNLRYASELAEMPNVHLISSPGIVNIGKKPDFEGFDVLVYHGFSLPYYADKVPELRNAGGLDKVSEVMKFYLQRRHFAPSHGSSQFIPDIRYDPLHIKKIPDIFITGHIHKISVDSYRGVTLINASAWVAPSEYQSRFGLEPDNCRAILMNLQTRDIKILNFEEENDDKKEQKDDKQGK
ncbi:MAG: metallophosphoesterase [Nanobdellota archaeon]